jgi:hypothetical protein
MKLALRDMSICRRRRTEHAQTVIHRWAATCTFRQQ